MKITRGRSPRGVFISRDEILVFSVLRIMFFFTAGWKVFNSYNQVSIYFCQYVLAKCHTNATIEKELFQPHMRICITRNVFGICNMYTSLLLLYATLFMFTAMHFAINFAMYIYMYISTHYNIVFILSIFYRKTNTQNPYNCNVL